MFAVFETEVLVGSTLLFSAGKGGQEHTCNKAEAISNYVIIHDSVYSVDKHGRCSVLTCGTHLSYSHASFTQSQGQLRNSTAISVSLLYLRKPLTTIWLSLQAIEMVCILKTAFGGLACITNDTTEQNIAHPVLLKCEHTAIVCLPVQEGLSSATRLLSAKPFG